MWHNQLFALSGEKGEFFHAQKDKRNFRLSFEGYMGRIRMDLVRMKGDGTKLKRFLLKNDYHSIPLFWVMTSIVFDFVSEKPEFVNMVTFTP